MWKSDEISVNVGRVSIRSVRESSAASMLEDLPCVFVCNSCKCNNNLGV